MTITVVLGPPCAGKSTFVAENAADGDVVVDFDRLAVAFGSKVSHDAPYAIRSVTYAAREAAIDLILSGIDSDAWIIHSAPPPDQMTRYEAAGARVEKIDPGVAVCLERASDDGRPVWTETAINRWYASEKRAGGPMLTKNTPAPAVNVKAGPDDGLNEGEFIVYPSTFTKTPDSYGDVVAPGAFLKSIQTWKNSGNVLPGLFGHRMDDPDFYVASAIDMGEDAHGWWVKGAFDLESPKGKHVYNLVKGRRLNQLSFAYDVIDEAGIELENGVKANELRELNLYEFSFVPVGANQDTSVVAVKSILDHVTREVKAGRVLSAKNESALRDAHESIGSVLAALSSTSDEEKASGDGPSHQDSEASESREANRKSSVDPSALLNAITASLDVEFV